MKISEFIEEAKKLQEEHGDLEVRSAFRGNLGPASIVMAEEVNYATPKPYLRTRYYSVGHINFNKAQLESVKPVNFRPTVKRA